MILPSRGGNLERPRCCWPWWGWCSQQPRLRRLRLGELIQIDGSDHAWFEERGASLWGERWAIPDPQGREPAKIPAWPEERWSEHAAQLADEALKKSER